MMRLAVYSFWLLVVSVLFQHPALAQRLTLSGLVREASTGQPVAGCEVYLKGSRQIARTDSAGLFTVPNLAPGRQQLQLSSISHEPLRVEVSLTENLGRQEFTLARRERTLKEVVVSAPRAGLGKLGCGKWRERPFSRPKSRK
ncbi:carboxypeptidase-like regulatory domain-containing protein [Hymenobacter qilianensis]|uniref:carboxypeptidase-like regulatory domain-containing protein n=1 Tax=Hymenobacter qilianensis TaxID=1385715 RepID=UPI001CB9B09E|nr:carboxypeptidase-like regulatory domain-containing protein [Hymenobacter qilianensis]